MTGDGWPKVAIVDAPSRDANIRLDLSTDAVYIDADRFSLGVPTLTSNDPATPGVEWDYREGMLLPIVVEDDETAARAVLQKLSRELLRTTNWLLYHEQPGDEPVWAKVYRTPPKALDLTEVTDRTSGQKTQRLWSIDVAPNADSLLYGEEVEIAAAIFNNPTSGTNPCRFVFPPIKGDAPAPLSVELLPTVAWADSTVRFSVVSSAEEIPALVWQAEDIATAGTGTSTGSEAGYSDGERVDVSFSGGASLSDRLLGVTPAMPAAGRYTVLMRAVIDGADTTIRVQLRDLVGGTIGPVRVISSPSSGAVRALVDLGEFVFPTGTAGLPNNLLPWDAPQIALAAGRDAGTAHLKIDYFDLIPVATTDVATARTTQTTISGSRFAPALGIAPAGVWDADSERFYVINTFTGAAATLLASESTITGGFPLVDPANENVFYLHQAMDDGGKPNDNIGASVTATFRYHPRYLNLPGDE